jgi:hypothetical protein
LVAASANNIVTTVTPAAAGGIALTGTTTASAFVGTGSIAANLLTITAVTSGVLQPGMALTCAASAAGTLISAYGTGTGGTGTYIVNVGQTVSSTTIYGNNVATLDKARRVLFTAVGNESAKTFTVTGTNWAGNTISETLTGPNATTAATVLDYLTVTSISISAAAAAAITVGTNGVSSSPWVRMDDYSPNDSLAGCIATGTVNYSVEQTLQDSNSPTNPVSPSAMVWTTSNTAALVTATTSIVGTLGLTPAWVRVTLNSGTGSVAATFSQLGVAPY